MTLWSAFAVVLSRYSGQSDLAIGSPIANRNHRDTESLIGCFVNTLVLRLDLSGNPSFAEVLQQARQVALDAYAHQDIPLERLVEALQPERNLSHTPFFQVMFVLQNAPRPKLVLPGLEATLLKTDSAFSKFDLTLELTETATGEGVAIGDTRRGPGMNRYVQRRPAVEHERIGKSPFSDSLVAKPRDRLLRHPPGLSGRLEYRTELFARATIERLAGHLQTLLTGIVENPETPIHQLPLLTPAEQAQLTAWNDTAADYPQDLCIHQLFEEAQVAKTPQAVAVVCEDQQLTYQELDTRANQLAHRLQTLGVRPEILVGLCLERSLDVVIGLLGVLKAGGTYVPLDPVPGGTASLHAGRRPTPVLLTRSDLKARLPETRAQVVCLDVEAEALSRLSAENPHSAVTLENLAIVVIFKLNHSQKTAITRYYNGARRASNKSHA